MAILFQTCAEIIAIAVFVFAAGEPSSLPQLSPFRVAVVALRLPDILLRPGQLLLLFGLQTQVAHYAIPLEEGVPPPADRRPPSAAVSQSAVPDISKVLAVPNSFCCSS